jgi:hypothetical protein
MITHKIIDIETGKVRNWTVSEMLDEINRDHSDQWTDYDESDYMEGWMEWVDGEFYRIIEKEAK